MKRTLHAGKRQSGGFSLNVFSDDELYEIHLATLEVLEKTGVFVEDQEALDIFKQHGVKVNGETVYFPGKMVESALEQCPATFRWRWICTKYPPGLCAG